MSKRISLTRYLVEQQRVDGHIPGDLRLLLAILAANLLAAFATHRLAKHSALRRLAPGWKSWDMGWKFPMGLCLAGTLAIYLGLGAIYGR